MIWESFIIAAADVLGMTTEQSGIFISLLINLVVSFSFGLLAKKKTAPVILGSMALVMVLTIFLGWFPVWTGSVLAMILAALAAKSMGEL
jgi:hypothetical protein